MSSCQNTGRLACPCATSYLGFRVANADSIGRLNVSVANSVCASGCDYGIEYGLNLCAAHDSGMPPFCNVPGAPAWCSSPWCYVNASHCAFDHAESSYLEGEGGLHYSYETCSAPDSFTDWYLARTGTLQLCSVFAEADGGGPCGTARTHLQIEAMVGAINELNGGDGFSLGSRLIPRTYRFNYTYHTYPAGSWATHGRNLSRATFASDRCDVVVGMASGCPDDEIAAQALVANETRRIYVTGRDPRVLTAGGAEQPYLFSTYVDSDHYARAALERYRKLGASSSALLYEVNGDPFYAGLGRQAIEDARALAYDVRYNASLRRRADGAVDYAALTAHLTAAHGTAPDVLVLTVPEPLFRFALERLKSWRPPYAPNAHVYSGVWWPGVASGNETCAGLAEECEHVTGAAQMASDEALRGYTDTLLEDTAYATYEQLRAARMPASSSGSGGDGGQLVEHPDAAAIPSLLAQALGTIFDFRDMPKPDKPLSDPLDYELLRSYLRSGKRIASTYIGPISFDARGQNVGRPPTLLQVSGGHAQPVLSQSAVSGAQLDYPAPAAKCPADAHRLDYDGSCLLCSASTCEKSTQGSAIWIFIATGVGGAGLLLLLVGFCFLRRRLRRQAVRFGLSPHRLAKLVGWRYLLPAVFQRWWLRRHHLDAHTQLRKAAKEAERPDEQFRAELRGARASRQSFKLA